jgi:hypothetical protein
LPIPQNTIADISHGVPQFLLTDLGEEHRNRAYFIKRSIHVFDTTLLKRVFTNQTCWKLKNSVA